MECYETGCDHGDRLDLYRSSHNCPDECMYQHTKAVAPAKAALEEREALCVVAFLAAMPGGMIGPAVLPHLHVIVLLLVVLCDVIS